MGLVACSIAGQDVSLDAVGSAGKPRPWTGSTVAGGRGDHHTCRPTGEPQDRAGGRRSWVRRGDGRPGEPARSCPGRGLLPWPAQSAAGRSSARPWALPSAKASPCWSSSLSACPRMACSSGSGSMPISCRAASAAASMAAARRWSPPAAAATANSSRQHDRERLYRRSAVRAWLRAGRPRRSPRPGRAQTVVSAIPYSVYPSQRVCPLARTNGRFSASSSSASSCRPVRFAT